MIRSALLFLLVMLACKGLVSQSNIVDPKLMFQKEVPLNPEAAIIDRYTMTPPNLSNGLPHQNVPLFEIKENGLNFPVSLFYNYSGFRVKEDATTVGLGWGLTEAVIVREVKHIPDEHQNLMKKFEDYGDDYEEEIGPGSVDGQYSYDIHVSDNVDHGTHNLTHNRQFYKYYDAQPDVYVYNFLGFSGKFLWLNNQAIKLDYNDLFIAGERDVPSNTLTFTITTPDGITCLFTEMDRTEVTPAAIIHPPLCLTNGTSIESYVDYGYTTAWRMVEMKSNVTQAKITFKYKSYSSIDVKTVDQPTSVTIFSPLQQNGNFFGTSYAADDSYVHTANTIYFIDEIESEHYKAVFQTNSRLDGTDQSRIEQIKVYNKSNLLSPLKTISFTHEYFGNTAAPKSCWLKLKKLSLAGAGINNEYDFSYVNELNGSGDKTGLSIDHWGYCNGASNASLVPFTGALQSQLLNSSNMHTLDQVFPFANRAPVFSFSQTFALEKIQYPTKGYTKMEYESSGGKGIRVHSLEDNDGIKSNFKYYDYGPAFTFPATYIAQEYGINQDCGTWSVLDPTLPLALPINQIVTIYGSEPDGSANFITDRSPFYEKVTEFIGTPDGNGGRTVYKFVRMDAVGNEVTLTEKTQYPYGSDDFVLQEKYNYSTPFLKTIRYWQVPFMLNELVPSSPCYINGTGQVVCGPADPEKGYILEDVSGGSALTYSYWKHLDEVETTSQGIHSSKKFFYSDINAETGLPGGSCAPIRIEETLSNGQEKKTRLYYPGSADPDNSAVSLGVPQMLDGHYITPVVASQTYIDDLLISQEKNHYTFDAANNIILKTDYEGLPTGSAAGKVKYQFSYDNKANLVGVKKENDIPRSFILGYNKLFPVADITNATASQVAYTSFEEEDYGNWTGVNPANIQTDANSSITGNKNYALTNSILQFASSPSQSYIVSYWSKNGSYNVNGTPATQGRTAVINDQTWICYQHAVTGVSSISVSGTGVIDELRLYPKDAQMNTYTYDILKGLTSKTDIGNHIVYYEYDDFGRLRLARDQDNNIVKKICYNYAGQPGTCDCINADPNWQNTATPLSCQQLGGGNTGRQEQEQRNTNVCSITYNQTRTILLDVNTSACPLIYVKITYENQTGNYADVVMRFYSDFEATIPVFVNNLTVNYQDETYNDLSSELIHHNYSRSCNGTELTLLYATPLVEQIPVTGNVANLYHDYFLNYGDGYVPL